MVISNLGVCEMMNGIICFEQFNEVNIGEKKYIHRSDAEYDYLTDDSNNKIKVNLRFTKNKDKNEIAKNGLKTFFSRIS